MVIGFLDPQNVTDNFIYELETDHAVQSELAAVNIDLENIPRELVLTNEIHGSELLNESIFVTSSF